MVEITFVRPVVASALRWISMAQIADFLFRGPVFAACVVCGSQEDHRWTQA
jgi:hypothetical protein